MFKCWILLKPVLVGVDGSLYFTLPSMNRLSQTEPAIFVILLCWAFIRGSFSLYFETFERQLSTFQTLISLTEGDTLLKLHTTLIM